MSFATYSDAVRDWLDTTYGASFNVTWGSDTIAVAVMHDNQEVNSNDVPAVRFVYSHAVSIEGSPALTEGVGALIAQVFTDWDISSTLAETIAGQIEDDTKRTNLTAVKLHFGPAYPQGPGSQEPTGLYQLNLRVPIWYLEAA